MDKEILKRKEMGKCFKMYRGAIKATKKKVKFVYVGKHFEDGSLILSNHESTKGPLSWDFFCDKQVRLLGTVEMNSTFKRMYKYQTEVYYHEKKHWNLFLARIFCLLATPATYAFYKGLDLISIREGTDFLKTLADCYTSLGEYKENLVIFPEDSEEGYLKRLTGFKKGFTLIAQNCYRLGLDVPIVVSYFNREKHLVVVGEPIKWSELIKKFDNKEDICEYLKDYCNELGDKSDTL